MKKALDEKYSYQIDENNVVHLFCGEEDCAAKKNVLAWIDFQNGC